MLYIFSLKQCIKQGTFYLPLYVVVHELYKAILLYIFSLKERIKQGTFYRPLYVVVQELCKAILLYILSLKENTFYVPLHVDVKGLPDVGRHN